MFASDHHASGDTARSPFDRLAGAIQRVLDDGERDLAELDHAIHDCARDARDAAEPPQRFVVQVKACARHAAVRAEPLAAASLTSHVVSRAVAAYYEGARA